MTTRKPPPDEEYIQAILRGARDGLTRQQFLAYCQPDLNAGWRREVYTALRRYRKKEGLGRVG